MTAALQRAHFRLVPFLLAVLGTAIVLGEVLRNWLWQHPIEGWVIAIGAAFGFFGYYLINPKGAKDAYGFVVDSSVRIIGVVRTGRRSTDVVAVAQAKDGTTATLPPTTTVTPVTPPTTPPVANDPEVP